MAQTDSRRAALTLGAAAAVLASLAAPVAAHAQAATYQFDIPQQPMASALRAFAQASRQQVVFDGAVVRDKQSPGVTGRLTADSALQALISGRPPGTSNRHRRRLRGARRPPGRGGRARCPR